VAARSVALRTGTDEAQWLGWLDVVDEQIAQTDNLRKIADEVRGAGFKHVLLLVTRALTA